MVTSKNSAAMRSSASVESRLPVDDEELLAQCALFDVHRVSRAMTVLYNAYLRETGLSMAQFTLLRNIAAMAPAGIKQIAEAMLMDRTSVTRLLEPLIKQQLIVIEVGEDRRYRSVVVTPEGLAAVARSETAWLKAQRELFKRIGSAQWRTMRTALRKTLHLVREMEESVGDA